MNKFTKGCLIFAAGCLTLGLVFCGIGAYTGGFTQIDETKIDYSSSFGRLLEMTGEKGVNGLKWLKELGFVDLDEEMEQTLKKAEDKVENAENPTEELPGEAKENVQNFITEDTGDWQKFSKEMFESWDWLDDVPEFEEIDWENADTVEGKEIIRGDNELLVSYSGKLSEIEVECDMESVWLLPSKNDNIYLKTENCRKLQCYVKKGVLHLESADNGINNLVNNNEGLRIYLYVPEDIYWENAEIDVDMGSIYCHSLKVKEADISANMGAIGINYIEADSAKLDTDMGSIQVRYGSFGHLEADTDMGSIQAAGRAEKDVKVDVDMGSATLLLAGAAEDFNYKYNAGWGSINVDGHSYSDLKNKTVTNEKAQKKMDLDCGMGAIEISFK